MRTNKFQVWALDYLASLVRKTEDIELLVMFIGFDEDGILNQDEFPDHHSCALALIEAAKDEDVALDCVRGLAMNRYIIRADAL